MSIITLQLKFALVFLCINWIYGTEYNCRWGLGEHVRRFVRIPEDARVGLEVFKVNVSRPDLLILRPAKIGAAGYLKPTWNSGIGRVVINRVLRDLPAAKKDASSILKFSLYCGDNPVSQQVTVYIDDVNNHPPVFQKNNLTVVVDELTPTGLTILPEIRVTDDDKPNTANSEIELFIDGEIVVSDNVDRNNITHDRYNASDMEKSHFEMVDRKKGQIILSRNIDFDSGYRDLELKVIAKDMGIPSMSSTMFIQVKIKDSDDLSPTFTHDKYFASIYEHPGRDPGIPIRTKIQAKPSPIKAFDGDVGINSTLEYRLIDNETPGFFSIDSTTGDIYVVKHIDREQLPIDKLMMHVVAKQTDNPNRESSAELAITILDVNDNLPEFENDVYAISIVENLPSGFSVVQVSANDKDLGENAMFTYFINGTNSPLSIDNETGWLTVSNQDILDRESNDVLTLHVCTKQHLPLNYYAKDFIFAGMKKENIDQESEPTELLETVTVENEAETVTPTTEFPKITTYSPSLQNGRTFPPRFGSRRPHRVQPLTNNNDFHNWEKVKLPSNLGPLQQSSSGRLIASTRVATPSFVKRNQPRSIRSLPLMPVDSTEIQMIPIHLLQKNGTVDSPCSTVIITLLDANDNNPEFIPSSHYEFSISKEILPGDTIGTVNAVDIDQKENGQVSYRLQAESSQTNNELYLSERDFDIDEHTGVITSKSRATSGETTLFIEASDNPRNPSETRTSLAIVSVAIRSNHLQQPEFLGTPYEFWVGVDAPVGTSVGQVRLTDMQDTALDFEMFHSHSENVPFGIEATSGIVAVTEPLTNITRSSYELEAVVKTLSPSKPSLTLSTNVTIQVAPETSNGIKGITRDATITLSVPENFSGGLVGDVANAVRLKGIRIPRDPRLQLVNPDMRKYFTLTPDGLLYTVAPLDFEEKQNHTLVVVSARSSLIFYVIVKVEDLNDNAPRFNAVNFKGFIQENMPPRSKVNVTPPIQVTDLDQYKGSQYLVNIRGPSSHQFTVNQETKDITFIGSALDRERMPFYSLVLEAVDDGKLSSTANLTIVVGDENDNPPRFLPVSGLFNSRDAPSRPTSRNIDGSKSFWGRIDSKKTLRIPESLAIGSKVTQVTARDNDINENGQISYEAEVHMITSFPNNQSDKLVSSNSQDLSVDSLTGSIVVANRLKPDTIYTLNITAKDGGGKKSSLILPVSVYDINDHEPRFPQPNYTFDVLEGEYVVSEIGKIVATDKDSGENGQLSYQIIPPAKDSMPFPFRIVESTGTVLVSGKLDREEQHNYEFTIQCQDNGKPPRKNSIPVKVRVIDVNDNSPEFVDGENLFLTNGPNNESAYRVSISEAAPPGTIVGRVNAVDKDKLSTGHGIVLYKLEKPSQWIDIDSQDGTIFTKIPLDFETSTQIVSTIIAHDMGKPPLQSSIELNIEVEDVENELNQRIFPQELYEIRVLENSNVPKRLARIHLNYTKPGKEPLHLRLLDPVMLSTFHLDPLTGDLLLIRSVDREVQPHIRFKIRAVEAREGRDLLFDEDFESNLPNGTASLVDPSQIKQIQGTPSPTLDGQLLTIKNVGNFHTGGRANQVQALGLDEAWVHIVVQDVNDNAPIFRKTDDPMVAAISSDAMIGDLVSRVLATDQDEGKNQDILYKIVPEEIWPNSAYYVTIHPRTGVIKVAENLENMAGQLITFTIQAFDRDGDDQANYAEVEAYIHVLGSASQLVLEIDAPPETIQEYENDLREILTNISKVEVRIQKISPRVDGDLATLEKTDVFIYGVDPLTKSLVEAKLLHELLKTERQRIKSVLPSKVSMSGIRALKTQKRGYIFKNAELAILIGALIVFVACVTSILCLCYRQKKGRRKPAPLPMGMSLGLQGGPANNVPIFPLPYPGHYPAPYTHMSEHSDSSESARHSQHELSQQMIEKTMRYPSQRHGRVLEPLRSPRSMAFLNTVEDEHWHLQHRSPMESSSLAGDDACPHICNHGSPGTQRHRGTSHHRDLNHDVEDGFSPMRYHPTRASQNHLQHHSHHERHERLRRNSHTCCNSRHQRPPSPDSLEGHPPHRHPNGFPPQSIRISHTALTDDVTEL